jgi:hypothetical protein
LHRGGQQGILGGVAGSQLSEKEQAILDFERSWWVLERGSKATAIRECLGISPAGYYGILDTLIDSPDARLYDPLVIARLQRRRALRRKDRIAGAARHPH